MKNDRQMARLTTGQDSVRPATVASRTLFELSHASDDRAKIDYQRKFPHSEPFFADEVSGSARQLKRPAAKSEEQP